MANKMYSAAEFKRQQYYKLFKWLAHDKDYKDLSIPAKYLYSILYARHELSIKNNWVDDKGNIYFIYRRAEMQELLNCGIHYPTECINELKKFKLIREVRVGLNQPNRLYLLEPKEPEIEPQPEETEEPANPHNYRIDEIRTSGSTESVHQEVRDADIRNDGNGNQTTYNVSNIYLLEPKEPAMESEPEEPANPHNYRSYEIRTSGSTESVHQEVRNADIRKYGDRTSYNISKNYYSKNEGERGASPLGGGQAAAPPPTEKEIYGEHFKMVRLHRGEFDLLVNLFGEVTAKDYVNRLDEHMATSEKKYINHYAHIYKWIMQDKRKKQADSETKPKPNKFANFNQRDTDFDKYEKLERALNNQRLANIDNAVNQNT